MSTPNGPQPGTTPPDSNELHGNGDNPYSSGEKWGDVSDVRSSTYPVAASIAGADGNPTVLGYYMNPAVDPSNAFSGQLGVESMGPWDGVPTRYMASGLEAAYGHAEANMTGIPDAPDPNSSNAYQESIRVDTAQDDQFVPIDDRK